MRSPETAPEPRTHTLRNTLGALAVAGAALTSACGPYQPQAQGNRPAECLDEAQIEPLEMTTAPSHNAGQGGGADVYNVTAQVRRNLLPKCWTLPITAGMQLTGVRYINGNANNPQNVVTPAGPQFTFTKPGSAQQLAGVSNVSIDFPTTMGLAGHDSSKPANFFTTQTTNLQ